MLAPLPQQQQIAGQDGQINAQVYRWLHSMMVAANLALPPKEIRNFALTSDDVTNFFDGTGKGNVPGPYRGWAICNGSNGTPDLRDKFIRLSGSASGATGGSDSSAHTHAIDHDHGSFTSAAESGHTHAIDHDHGAVTSGAESGHTHAIDHDHASFTSGAGSAHSHTSGTLAADISLETGTSLLVRDLDDAGFTYTHEITSVTITDVADAGAGRSIGTHGSTATESAHTHAVDVPSLTGTSGASSGHTHSVDVAALTGTSGASSGHTHSIDVPALTGTSGAASATDNKPAYYTLVALMRLENPQ